jgi:hypothetical protein
LNDAPAVAEALSDLVALLDAKAAAPGAAGAAVATPDHAAAQAAMLGALGYLDPATARAQFLDDAQQAGLFLADPAAPDTAEDDLFDLVAQALTLRPVLPAALPAHGECSLRSRILQARLAMLGARMRPVGLPVDADDDLELIGVHCWLEPPDAFPGPALLAQVTSGARDVALLPVLRRVADADATIAALLERDPHGFLVTASPMFRALPEADADVFTDDQGGFVEPRHGLGALLHPGAGDPPRALLTVAFGGDPDQAVQDNGNRVGLRLIQLKLRRLGLYAGPIDALFGPATWNAMIGVGGLIEPNAAFDGLLPALRMLPSGRHVALSLRYLVRNALAASAATPEALAALLQQQDTAMLTQSFAGLLEAEAAPQPGLSAPPAPQPSFFRSFVDVVHRVFEAIRDGLHQVGHFVAELFSPVMDLLRWARQAAARLVRLLRQALAPVNHLILGEPFGNAAIASKIYPDRDVISFAAPRADPALVRQHLDQVRQETRMLAWAGRVLAVALRLILDGVAGPVGWVHLLLAAVSVIPDLVGAPEAG